MKFVFPPTRSIKFFMRPQSYRGLRYSYRCESVRTRIRESRRSLGLVSLSMEGLHSHVLFPRASLSRVWTMQILFCCQEEQRVCPSGHLLVKSVNTVTVYHGRKLQPGGRHFRCEEAGNFRAQERHAEAEAINCAMWPIANHQSSDKYHIANIAF